MHLFCTDKNWDHQVGLQSEDSERTVYVLASGTHFDLLAHGTDGGRSYFFDKGHDIAKVQEVVAQERSLRGCGQRPKTKGDAGDSKEDPITPDDDADPQDEERKVQTVRFLVGMTGNLSRSTSSRG